MHKLLTAVFCSAVLSAVAQQRDHVFSKQLTMITENDAYLFRKHDAYYTNGIFFGLQTADERGRKKIVSSFDIGQMIYTPLIRKTVSTSDIDRPYCGFLFARYSRTAFSASLDELFQYSFSLGVVGNASLGEDLQNSYHRVFNYARFTGWQYQVQNALGADAGIMYATTILEDSGWLKLVPQLQATLGSNYTNAKAGMYFCLGAFEKNSNSALWNAVVQRGATKLRRNHELFLYWYPELVVQGYNATLQGGLFNKGNGAVLADPERLMFQHTAGLFYAENRWTVKLAVTFQDREALSQKTAQQFGSIQLGYRMR